MKNNAVLALVGNPNSGKTTLFNQLTGANQRVGNWPGVTVEKKTGITQFEDYRLEIIDLPGTYNLSGDFDGESVDEEIAQQYINDANASLLVNIIDASSLERGLYLTCQLKQSQKPMIVALNMLDVATSKGFEIDIEKLSDILNCPVIPILASKNEGIKELMSVALSCIEKQEKSNHLAAVNPKNLIEPHKKIQHIYQQVDQACEQVLHKKPLKKKPLSERIDDIALNKFLAFPLFLLAMYLLFFFAINIGSAFQEFFDTLAGIVFIDTPRAVLTWLQLPDFFIALICDGIGSGIQLIIQFIPVIAALFFALSFLEDVGYMTRAAFIVDRLMKAIGLPGKAFIPLIVGFGCNVPSVMATRTLNKETDRLVTSLMSPFMSCGARLTVYTLFVAVFFPVNGHNILFLLYLLGIVVAIFTAFLVRKFIFVSHESNSVMELPPYLLPTMRNLFTHTWHKLKGFCLRAGKSIISVVIILNILNSIGTDGTFGNENQNNSVLSYIGKMITPAFSPMGLKEENWPATVGIFTGMFAKEVVVGTLNELYSSEQIEGEVEETVRQELKSALLSIPVNLKEAFSSITNLLGMPDKLDKASVAESEDVTNMTFKKLQGSFSSLSALAYLIFILLYMPCVATVGAFVKEHGGFWALFSVIWSYSIAYTLAVLTFQIGSFQLHPLSSTYWIVGIVAWQILLLYFIVKYGRKHAVKQRLIPAINLH